MLKNAGPPVVINSKICHKLSYILTVSHKDHKFSLDENASYISNHTSIDRYNTQIFQLFLETFFSKCFFIKNRVLFQNRLVHREKNGSNTYFWGPRETGG